MFLSKRALCANRSLLPLRASSARVLDSGIPSSSGKMALMKRCVLPDQVPQWRWSDRSHFTAFRTCCGRRACCYNRPLPKPPRFCEEAGPRRPHGLDQARDDIKGTSARHQDGCRWCSEARSGMHGCRKQCSHRCPRTHIHPCCPSCLTCA